MAQDGLPLNPHFAGALDGLAKFLISDSID
jgi:hypothetical protein